MRKEVNYVIKYRFGGFKNYACVLIKSNMNLIIFRVCRTESQDYNYFVNRNKLAARVVY